MKKIHLWKNDKITFKKDKRDKCVDGSKLKLNLLTRQTKSNRPEVFCKLFVKKETPKRLFSCEFCGISKNTLFCRPTSGQKIKLKCVITSAVLKSFLRKQRVFSKYVEVRLTSSFVFSGVMNIRKMERKGFVKFPD